MIRAMSIITVIAIFLLVPTAIFQGDWILIVMTAGFSAWAFWSYRDRKREAKAYQEEMGEEWPAIRLLIDYMHEMEKYIAWLEKRLLRLEGGSRE